MQMDHVVFAYGFDGKGGGIPLEGGAISQLLEDERLAWVHLNAYHKDTQKWLDEEIAYLDPFIIEALLEEETRPRMTQIDDGVLLILRGVNLNDDAHPEDMVSVRLWVDKHRIISLQRRQLKAVGDLEARLNEGRGPADAGEFVSSLAEQLFDRMENTLSVLDEQTDNIEEAVLEDASISLRSQIIQVRKQAIIFRRHMAPQREAIAQLCASDISWLDRKDRRQLQECFNQVTRYVEDLDAIRERSQVVKDELATMLANRLNKNMYILSVIAAVFLPLGFLTGLMGVNLGGIPGEGNPLAFFEFSLILVALVLVQVIIFKRLKWF